MNSAKSFKSLLLFEVDMADKIDVLLTDIALMYLLPIVMISVLWELFSSNNVLAVGKSMVFSLVLLFSFTKIYKATVDYSFDIAYDIVSTKGGKNAFIKTWDKLLKNNSKKDKSFQNKFRSAIQIISSSDDIVLSLISVAVLGVLVLTSAIYTLGYYLNYIFIGVSALVGILPISKSILIAPIKGLLWSAIVPIGCAVIVALIGSILDVEANKDGQFVYNLKSYVEVGVLSICIFLMLPGVYAFLNGQTFGAIAGTMGTSVANSALMGGAISGGAYVGGKLSGISKKSTLGLTSPIRSFSKIAKGAIHQDAKSLMLRFGGDERNNLGKNIPEIFSDKVKKDVARGRGAVASAFSPRNHVKTIQERAGVVKNQLKNNDVSVVYSKVRKNSGHLSAIGSASIVATDKILNKGLAQNSGQKKDVIPKVKTKYSSKTQKIKTRGSYDRKNKRTTRII